MNAFEQYLALHEIDLIRLTVVAKIRYLTVYNAKKGNPITSENAKKIKEALLNMTGIPYTGSFVLIHASGVPLSTRGKHRDGYPAH
jgi:hypothetical protein